MVSNIELNMPYRLKMCSGTWYREQRAMTCFLDATSYSPDTYIEDADGNRVRCQDSIKALGMRFSNKPDMSVHVEWVAKNMREQFWTLINLKKSGFTTPEHVLCTNQC